MDPYGRYEEVYPRYEEAHETVCRESRLIEMLREEHRLEGAFDVIPFDTRFNAVLWAFDCLTLAREIVYSYCWMQAHAEETSTEEAIRLFYVRYYADNCITRINSFRDKAALLAWAYYCPFNPDRKEEVLGLSKIQDRLRCPLRFGLKITGQKAFLTQLDKLMGQPFDRAAQYRHLKIHRREPKILLRPATESDGLRYMVPLFRRDEILGFDERLAEIYPDPCFREVIKESCYVRETLFNRQTGKDEFWDYAEIQAFTRECVYTCVDVARGLSAVLRRRAPLKGR